MPTKAARARMAQAVERIHKVAAKPPAEGTQLNVTNALPIDGCTYGERIVGQSPAFKGLSISAGRRLAASLDDAYNAGERDKARWASGVHVALRDEQKELARQLREKEVELRRLRKLCDLMLEKYALS